MHFLDLMPRSMPVLDDTADKGFAFMPAPANLGSELWVIGCRERSEGYIGSAVLNDMLHCMSWCGAVQTTATATATCS